MEEKTDPKPGAPRAKAKRPANGAARSLSPVADALTAA